MATKLESDVRARLSNHDVRLTPGRLTVVRELDRAHGPRSAADLHDEIGSDVPLSSIYRTLAVLEDAGIVRPHHSSKSVTRYELSEWLTGHHHHLVCQECGTVEDVEMDQETERQLEEIVTRIGSVVAFEPTDHALEIDGVCARCH
jgi:Fur family ferric uptake transcriptional regulator